MISLVHILQSGVTDDSGAVLASGTVRSYVAGTTTLTTLYQDFELETPHSNPLTLDAAGRAKAYVDGRVKLVISNSSGTVVRTIDNVGMDDSDVASSITANTAGSGLVANGNAYDVNVDGSTLTIENDALSVVAAGIVDNSTIEASENALRVKDAGITLAKLSAITKTVSSSSGSYTNTNLGVYADVTNLSVTITTVGRMVEVFVQPDGHATNMAYFSSATGSIFVRLLRDGSAIANWALVNGGEYHPANLVFRDFNMSAGSRTYKLQVAGTANVLAANMVLGVIDR